MDGRKGYKRDSFKAQGKNIMMVVVGEGLKIEIGGQWDKTEIIKVSIEVGIIRKKTNIAV